MSERRFLLEGLMSKERDKKCNKVSHLRERGYQAGKSKVVVEWWLGGRVREMAEFNFSLLSLDLCRRMIHRLAIANRRGGSLRGG